MLILQGYFLYDSIKYMSILGPKKTYLDYASGGIINKSIAKRIGVAMALFWANSSSPHSAGEKSNIFLNNARNNIASYINAHNDEIFFTSSATESIALAIMGTVYAAKKEINLPHIITSTIEHSAVLETCKLLSELKMAKVSYVAPDEFGIININEIVSLINKDTVIISIHLVNSEIGVVQNINDLIKKVNLYKEQANNIKSTRFFAKPFYPYIHLDACQAFAHMDISPFVRKGVELMSYNSVKINGPQGIAVLYKKRHTDVMSIYGGGNQEMNLRPGTVPHALAYGFSLAVSDLKKVINKNEEKYTELKKYLLDSINKISNPNRFYFTENSNEKSIPSIINLSFPYLTGQQLAIELDARRVIVSSKSACKSSDAGESYVIQEISKKKENKTYNQLGSIRISFGNKTNKKDIDKLLIAINDIARTYKGVLY